MAYNQFNVSEYNLPKRSERLTFDTSHKPAEFRHGQLTVSEFVISDVTQTETMAIKVPPGIRVLPSFPNVDRNVSYRVFILILTFFTYTSYHLSRKPISIVKSVLHVNCTNPPEGDKLPDTPHFENDTEWCNWSPFDHNNYSTLFGTLDVVYLFSYALGMFCCGHIAERMNLRYFLSTGMILCGIMTSAFGVGYFANIHVLGYYIAVQVLGGMVQATGWPSVVTCVGNWYGKGKRGLIMGIWNSHTSVGNILGSLVASAFVNYAWGWSFVVPGIIITSMGVIVFFFLVPHPEDVDCTLPDHQGNSISSSQTKIQQEKLRSDSRTNVHIDSSSDLLSAGKEEKPINFFSALQIPGVIEFSLCLFFAKLVSYTFLFWLPVYISKKSDLDPQKAGDLSTLFDVGGIFGGILAGLISDYTGARATTCVLQLALAAPIMYIYNLYGSISLAHNIGLSMLCGFMVNGPYALITTAVSADLGTHKILKGNSKALATVTAIIDGTGSIGAALGPLLTGLIQKTGWNNVFWMLIAADLAALLVSLAIASHRDIPRMFRQYKFLRNYTRYRKSFVAIFFSSYLILFYYMVKFTGFDVLSH